jgi:hypothetical protein
LTRPKVRKSQKRRKTKIMRYSRSRHRRRRPSSLSHLLRGLVPCNGRNIDFVASADTLKGSESSGQLVVITVLLAECDLRSQFPTVYL